MAEDNRNKPLYMISVAAELTGMHPQTLRVYESKGLVNPQRSGGNTRLYSSGFGKKRTLPGHEKAEVYILLQRRWEDADGKIHAKRVGTGRRLFDKSTPGWVNGYEIPVWYGDITTHAGYKPYMGLIPEEKSYYAMNSKGKMVPVIEEGWDEADATPTHMLVMASAAQGEPYVGTIDMTLWLDNIGLVY